MQIGIVLNISNRNISRSHQMKRIRTLWLFIFSITLIIPFTGFSQNMNATDSIQTKLKETARKIMTSAGTCTLITVDENNRPRAREMDAFPVENDFTVWFGTNSNSRKVQQIKNNTWVTLYYLDTDRSGYVMIYGKGQIVDDVAEKENRWKTSWEAFYPNREENYTLIKVIPEWMEVLSEKYGISSNPSTWEPPKIYFKMK